MAASLPACSSDQNHVVIIVLLAVKLIREFEFIGLNEQFFKICLKFRNLKNKSNKVGGSGLLW